MTLVHRALSTALLAAPLVAQGQTWSVDNDPGPGVDFTSIAAAVAAAAPGDAIFVGPGTYPEPEMVVDKSLLIASTTHGSVTVNGAITFSQLAAGDYAVLRDLDGALRIRIEDCDGAVWIDDCNTSGQGTVVENSDRVSIVRSVSLMGPSFGGAAPALEAIDSTLYVYDSTFLGSTGSGLVCLDAASSVGVQGGDAIALRGGEAYFFSAFVSGGPGGSMTFGGASCSSCFGGSGGIGLVLLDGAVAHVNNTTLDGGSAGQGIAGCSDGSAGTESITTAGDLSELDALERSLETPAVATLGQLLPITVHATPGDTTFVYAALAPALTPMPQLEGVAVIAGPPVLIGVTAAPSPSTVQIGVPALPGLQFSSGFVQGLAVTSQGLLRLTGPAQVTLLAP